MNFAYREGEIDIGCGVSLCRFVVTAADAPVSFLFGWLLESGV